MAYNVVEAVIAVTAGLVAGSVALVGFGLDSVVEVSSGLIILWQFRHRLPETREKQALRLMAFSFFALAAYVFFESFRSLVVGHEPDPSPVGIILAAVSLAIMPFLSWAQRRTGKALGSNAVVADSTPDPPVHLPVRSAAHRTRAERHPGMDVGRSGRRTRHRWRRGTRGRGSVARRRMLCSERSECIHRRLLLVRCPWGLSKGPNLTPSAGPP
ncbi:cation transporter [Aeromicrobium sp. UC242_57]|uniref:cation transporter n=1 Tax=Aeromicrobium sp. UC242_57 TaxID=3374624 RepID=UPI0037BF35C6